MTTLPSSSDQTESISFSRRLKAGVLRTTRISSEVIKTPIVSIPCITGFCSLGCVGMLFVFGMMAAFFLQKPTGGAVEAVLPDTFPHEVSVLFFEQVNRVDIQTSDPRFFQKIFHMLGGWLPRADKIYDTADYSVFPQDDQTTVTMDWIDLPQDRVVILAHYGRLFNDMGYELQTRHDEVRFIDEGYAAKDGTHVHVFMHDPVDNQVTL